MHINREMHIKIPEHHNQETLEQDIKACLEAARRPLSEHEINKALVIQNDTPPKSHLSHRSMSEHGDAKALLHLDITIHGEHDHETLMRNITTSLQAATRLPSSDEIKKANEVITEMCRKKAT